MVSTAKLRTHLEQGTLDSFKRACQVEDGHHDPITVDRYREALREEIEGLIRQLELDNMQHQYTPEKAELEAFLRYASHTIQISERIAQLVLRELYINFQFLEILNKPGNTEDPPNRIKNHLSGND